MGVRGQSGRQSGMQAGRWAGSQACMQVGRQSGMQAGRWAGMGEARLDALFVQTAGAARQPASTLRQWAGAAGGRASWRWRSPALACGTMPGASRCTNVSSLYRSCRAVQAGPGQRRRSVPHRQQPPLRADRCQINCLCSPAWQAASCAQLSLNHPASQSSQPVQPPSPPRGTCAGLPQ